MSRLRAERLQLPREGGQRRAKPGTRALVLGGGIAGVSAATILTERGVKVTLVERERYLGGRAGAFDHTLSSGERVQMERGFHGFFRQYYNLRALLARVDPALGMLSPLDDYPILGPGGLVQRFRGLPTRTPLQVGALCWRSPHLGARDLARANKRAALEMLAFEQERTYRRFDHMTAAEYLRSVGLPETARRMLFDVFSHSFFNPESEMSAADLLMMFHFYFTGNAEGLVFDVANRPLSHAIWKPFESWLTARGAQLHLGSSAHDVQRHDGGFVVHHDRGMHRGELLVLALDVSGLRRLVDASESLQRLQPLVGELSNTRPFAVWRLWIDRPLARQRPPFAGTTGVGILDNISLYERFQDESAAWARAHGGSVVELHAYAVAPELDEHRIKTELLRGLHTFYPESQGARIVDDYFTVSQDCPGFTPGGHRTRPGVETPYREVALAGDFARMPFPCALMERAAASGMLAANVLLSASGVQPEPLHSVPSRGLFAPPRLRARTTRRAAAPRREVRT